MSSSLPIIFCLFSSLTAAPTPLTVAAAADLSALEPALASSFGKMHPEVSVRFVTGSSALLAQQIENGAPYDVFLSANAQFVDRLDASGKLLAESVQPYAVGRVAILWRDAKHHPLNDLAADWVRFVALPNPKLAPYGAAAEQALQHARLWQRIEPKVVYGENVRQALQLFDSGNTDAVLTAASLLSNRDAELIPADWHAPIRQKLAIVGSTRNRAEARAFVAFLLSPGGQAVFARFGLAKP